MACLSSASSNVLERVEYRVGDKEEEYYGLVYVPEHHEVFDVVVSWELATEEGSGTGAVLGGLMDFAGAKS